MRILRQSNLRVVIILILLLSVTVLAWLAAYRLFSGDGGALLTPLATTPAPTGPPLFSSTVTSPTVTAAPRSTATRPPALPVPTLPPKRLYWGAWLDGQPMAAAFEPQGTIHTFETEVGKGLALIHWGQAWRRDGEYQLFPAVNFDNIRQHGSIPLLDWGAWVAGAGPAQPDFQLSAIAAGAHDTYLRQWARAAQAWGHPFLIRFGWEMNGDWKYPWSEQLNGNRAGDYVKAWRHVHDLFAEAGTANVTWVWCPNISGGTTLPYASLYPGDGYVDWTCLDGFNFYPAWIDFDTVFTAHGIDWLGDSYAQVLAIAPHKPMIIVTGSLEAGDGGAQKAAWITDAFTTQLANGFPAVGAVIWFNWDGDDASHATLPIESSGASLAAFSAAIQPDYFAGNEFSQLDTARVAPLP